MKKAFKGRAGNAASDHADFFCITCKARTHKAAPALCKTANLRRGVVLQVWQVPGLA